jgi:hypothetical protein
MAGDIVFGIKLTADGSAYIGPVRIAAAETEKLAQAARGVAPAMAESTTQMTKAVAIGSELGRMAGDVARQFANWLGQTITGTAQLKDLSDATGSSVEDLSRLVNVAKISGVSLGELQIATQRLSVNLAGTDDESKKATRALQALGVTTKDPAQAMEQLAQRLAQYRDGAEKAALVQEILGRGAQALLPYLKDLAEQHGVAATVSTRQAQAAEELEKSWRTLGIQAETLRNAALGPLIPVLSQIIDSWRNSSTAANEFRSSSESVGAGLLKLNDIAQYTVNAFINLGRGIGAVAFALDQGVFGYEKAKRALEDWANESIARTAAVRKSLEATRQAYDVTLRAREDRGFDPRQIAPITPARAKAIVDPLAKELDRLEERWRNLFAADQAGVNPQTVRSLQELDKLLDQARISWDEYTHGIEIALDADRRFAEEQKRLNDIDAAYARMLDELDDAEQRRIDSVRKFVESLEDQNSTLQDEITVLGLSGTARELRLSQLQRERALNAATNDVERDRIRALYDERDALIATKGAAQEYAEQQRQAFEDVDRIARDVFESMFDKGDDTFKRLRDSLKHNFVDALYQLTIRPWVIQMVASLTGGNVGALTSLVGGSGGNPLSNIFGLGKSLGFGNLTSGGIFAPGGALSGFATGATGQALGLSAVPGGAGLAEGGMVTAIDAMASAGEVGTAALTGFGTALGAAIPVVGAVVAGLSLFGSSLFKSEPSEVRGRFQVSPGAEGFEDNAYTGSRFGNLGFSDADTAQFSGEGAQVFNKIVSGALDAFEQRYSQEQSDRLAGILQSTDFGSFEGTFTTEEFIQKYGGQVLQQVVSAAFDVLDPALGSVARQFKGTAEEIAKFGNTLLAVYDLTKSIGNADFTATVDEALGGATQESADKVLAFVNVVATFGDAIDGLGPKLEALDASSITEFVDALGGAEKFLNAFAFLNQNFTTAAERSTNAPRNLTRAWNVAQVSADDLAKAGLTSIPRTHDEFMRLFNSLDLNTEHGRELANELLNNVAPAFVAVQGSADAAAEALKRQAEAGRDYYVDKFLTPDEQKLNRQTVDSTALYEMSKSGTVLNRVLAEMGLSTIPTTIQGVRQWHDAVIAKYGADSAEAQAMLAAIPIIGDLIDTVDGFGDKAEEVADQIARAWQGIDEQLGTFDTMLGNLSNLASSAPDFGTGLEDAVLLYTDQIDKLNERITAALAKGQWSQVDYVLRPELAQVTQLLDQAKARLDRYNELVALYGEAQASQLQQLEEQYHADLAIFGNNAAAVEILTARFTKAWTDIRTGSTEAAASLDDFITKIKQFADSTRGDAGQQADLEMALSLAKIDELTLAYRALNDPASAEAGRLYTQIVQLRRYNEQLAQQSAHFAIYAAQYGKDAANQLVNLENEFEQWKAYVGDNADALAILQDIFDDQWQAIIDSLKGGVDGSLEELARLKQGIAEYLQSLYVSDISPLSPQDKLNQARAAYEQELALAKTGDTKALGDITQYADTLLQLDRDFYKSSDAFVEEFNRITEDLAGLAGTLPNGLPVPTGDPSLALAAALPVGSPIASSADIKANTDATIAQSTLIQQLITALANANSEDARLITEALLAQQYAAADATAGAAK